MRQPKRCHVVVKKTRKNQFWRELEKMARDNLERTPVVQYGFLFKSFCDFLHVAFPSKNFWYSFRVGGSAEVSSPDEAHVPPIFISIHRLYVLYRFREWGHVYPVDFVSGFTYLPYTTTNIYFLLTQPREAKIPN